MAVADHGARPGDDAAARARALDPATSFLVQAPAGSGKTELLIQRYLVLLARVESPQRVVAMTFTRKAASEMRERVVAALQAARDDLPVTGAHARVTRDLALAVLAQGERRGWSLLAHPAQLAILTIDALSARLARQAPVTGSMGAEPRIVERAAALYTEAARATLADADPADAHWRRLLAHLDNDAQDVVDLLASMLARREQWLPHVTKRDEGELRMHVENALRAEIDAELGAVYGSFDPALLPMLARCAGRAVEVLDAEGRAPALARALELCHAQGGLPRARHEDLDGWRGMASWLCTTGDTLRRKMDIRQGVRPGKQYAAARGDVEALLAATAVRPGIALALKRVRDLPDARFADDDWEIVAALLHVLPRAAAQLRVTFARQGAVDFAELNTAAALALGAADSPSDLLLRLDLTIDHLLVDEFQDTSEAQYRLIELLTSGWEPGDGRTLFAVGDPMQSIYRFRDAEVRLFLAAIDARAIGSVPVEFVELTRNFRSQGALVAWANGVFSAVLGVRNEPWRGAVAFAPSTATHHDDPAGAPTLEVVSTRAEEAACVVGQVRAALARGSDDIAILVRARSDLDFVLPALREARIGFAAVELDALGARQAVQDVAALAHAMIQPADRLAALSVLRAPWCGLVLADLFLVAGHLREGLPGLIAALPDIAGLSDDGRARLARIARVLAAAFAEHGRAPLADRVRGTWLALGGSATLTDAVDFGAVEDFLALLASHGTGGDVDDWQALRDELDLRFVTSPEEAITQVKVMTLFKAKGLEFDTVIIPGLARVPPPDDRELLRWRSRPRGLLLAAPGAQGRKNPVYEYLNRLRRSEADHELGRILYVGATRARRRLHLVATARTEDDVTTGRTRWKTPPDSTALRKLWGLFPAEAAPPPDGASQPASLPLPPSPPLLRLASGFVLPTLPPSVPAVTMRSAREAAPEFEWARPDAAIVGTVTHRHLARRAKGAARFVDAAHRAELLPRIRADLVAEGLPAAALDAAAAQVLAALAAVADDPRGRWLFDPAHADAHSEWALAGMDAGALVHVTLDRSFVSEGVRWIVDFKTGRHEGADAAAFMTREEERYRPQLARYARIVRGLDARPIRLALYYPLVPGGWREWAFEPAGTQTSLF